MKYPKNSSYIVKTNQGNFFLKVENSKRIPNYYSGQIEREGDFMEFESKIKSFKYIDKKGYPELKGYSAFQIYEDYIGCGGLYL